MMKKIKSKRYWDVKAMGVDFIETPRKSTSNQRKIAVK